MKPIRRPIWRCFVRWDPWGLEELDRHCSPNWYRVYRAAKEYLCPLGRCGGVARAVREAFAATHCGCQASARSAGAGASLGFSHERRSGSRDAAIAGLPAHAAFWSARLQRRHTRKKAASGAIAARVAEPASRTVRVRVRRRFSGGFANGEARGSSGDRGTWTFSHGKALACGAAGFSAGVGPGTTGSLGGNWWLTSPDKFQDRGFGAAAGGAAAGAGAAAETGLKSVHLTTNRTGTF